MTDFAHVRWGRLAPAFLLSSLMLVLGCLPSASLAANHPARSLKKVNALVGFTWSSGQYYSMFLQGVKRGTYAKHGLDVTFNQGQGSASTSQIVANGQADIAVAVDPGSMIRADVAGADLEMVGQTMPYSPIAVLSKAPNEIKSPKDLLGKKIGVPPGTTQSQLFPAFLKKNHISESQLTIVNTPAATLQQSLASGQVDGFVSFAFSQIPILQGMGLKPYAMLLGNFGLKYAPGEGIIVKRSTIESDPTMVKEFVAATEETLEYASTHVTQAAVVGEQEHPEAIQARVATQQMNSVFKIFKTSVKKGQPMLLMQKKNWVDLVKLLTQYAGLQNAASPTSYYTNKFVPKAKS